MKERIKKHFENKKMSKTGLSKFISEDLGYRYHSIFNIYDNSKNLKGFMIDLMGGERKIYIEWEWK
jgi:hypothetical protein